MSIVIEHLNYIYMQGGPYETRALDDVSLTIHDGEFIGLIGHTGSGKSTLVQHLNGLILPTSGKITVDGMDLAEKGTDRRAIRRRVGLVFQYPENQLFEETVAKDIAFGPKNLGLDEAEIDRRVRTAMRRVALDYDKLAQRSVFELSGGQMRRVAIAGVLAMEPQTLVLDEPCAGLDPRGREEILGLISDLHRESGATIVMVSHSMDDVAALAERVIVMNHVSMLDPIVPYCELFYAGRNTRAIYKSEFNKVGIMRSILAVIGGIPVERGTADVKALRRAQRSLQAGESLLVYPEGTRVKAGEPSVLHGGFALMAKMAHTKVIPMAIVGARDITPRGKHIPRPGKVYCKVGQPLDFDRFEGLGRKEQVVAMEQAAWDEVIRLRDELRDEHPGKM